MYCVNPRGVDLRGADPRGVDLYCVDLYCVDRQGAEITDSLTLIGNRPLLQIGPIGSDARVLMVWITNDGLRLQTGGFFGTVDDFMVNLNRDHTEEKHRREYLAALELAKIHYGEWQ